MPTNEGPGLGASPASRPGAPPRRSPPSLAGRAQPESRRGSARKKFVYVEPPRRVKEVLEEELYFRRDECRIKHPSEVALEGIWSLKRNFPVGGFKPASSSQTPSSLLPQPKYYSRHAVIGRQPI
ncbi:uncharacterized protein C11orf97 homolog isoform X1 [Paroedura picta]|uniref:uncharacterized protein C11orf97 homolog isoform X1 n=1 Tax=Paroedura picta TaxID=143630 RepID=UPI0040563827